MLRLPSLGRDGRVNALIGCGHFLSHYYQLCLPPMFIVWQQAFGVSYAELGLAMALMSGTTAVVQAPIGFLVDRYGARRFLIIGTSLMTLSIAGMGLATEYWQIALLAMLSGLGNSVIHPADYAILSGSVDPARIGRSFSLHTFVGHVGFAAAPPITAALILLIGWRNTLLLVGLLGGWVADRTDRHLSFVLVLTIAAACLFLFVDLTALPQLMTILLLFASGLMIGASRTPRDVMVKDAAPPGQIGKVFGFISAGLSLGGAIMPVPYGMLIDAGRPELVLVLVSGLWLASLLFMGNARAATHREAVAPAAAD